MIKLHIFEIKPDNVSSDCDRNSADVCSQNPVDQQR